MIHGLDLFSGIGGITIALSEWVKPIAYCENDRYAQAVLLSRMSEGHLPIAPIWDDVSTLRKQNLEPVDIIYGGFPCQDISIAGHGVGLEGSRSGLFFEIVRLVSELRPKFVFLENVPAISVRGLDRVLLEFTSLRYDCRWTTLSAGNVGAPHLRERWWLLAYANRTDGGDQWKDLGRGHSDLDQRETIPRDHGEAQFMADASSFRGWAGTYKNTNHNTEPAFRSDWWETEPAVGRVVDGLPFRMDRISCLGNAVVPLQARTAFKMLMGIK